MSPQIIAEALANLYALRNRGSVGERVARRNAIRFMCHTLRRRCN